MTQHDNGEPDDVRFPSKLWEAINKIMTRHQIIENRMETVEVGMGEYGRRHQDINVKLEKITEKCWIASPWRESDEPYHPFVR